MPASNPYGTATTILDATLFFGRIDTLDYLFSEIVAKRCVSVVGVRRIGKSSLLRALCMPEIQQRFTSLYDLHKFLLIYVDFGELLSKTTDDFFTTVCQQLVTQSAGRLTTAMLEEEVDAADRFCFLLDELHAQDVHAVLLFDAFHKITKNTHLDARFFSFMRSQANNGRVSYITASFTTLDKCSHPYIEDSPFFNIFSVYPLGPLTHEEARGLIAAPTEGTEFAFTDDEIDEIRLLAGRHPFFLQRVAFLLFNRKFQVQGITTKLKQDAMRDLLPHFKDIWEHSLDAEQREYLRDEARWRHVKHKRLPELGESALFRKFVRDTFQADMIELTVEDLETILDNLSNSKQLSECSLTHLALFYTRLPQGATLTANERAALVRRILHEARDKTRPEGKQSDTAPEWEAFNILNGSYFMDHMKNAVLAQKLNISVRQLQRERTLAVESLRDILSDMEVAAKETLE